MELNIYYGFNWPMIKVMIRRIVSIDICTLANSIYWSEKLAKLLPLVPSQTVSCRPGHSDKYFPTQSVIDVTWIGMPAAWSDTL